MIFEKYNSWSEISLTWYDPAGSKEISVEWKILFSENEEKVSE